MSRYLDLRSRNTRKHSIFAIRTPKVGVWGLNGGSCWTLGASKAHKTISREMVNWNNVRVKTINIKRIVHTFGLSFNGIPLHCNRLTTDDDASTERQGSKTPGLGWG